jgi:hypothetical protein
MNKGQRERRSLYGHHGKPSTVDTPVVEEVVEVVKKSKKATKKEEITEEEVVETEVVEEGKESEEGK